MKYFYAVYRSDSGIVDVRRFDKKVDRDLFVAAWSRGGEDAQPVAATHALVKKAIRYGFDARDTVRLPWDKWLTLPTK